MFIDVSEWKAAHGDTNAIPFSCSEFDIKEARYFDGLIKVGLFGVNTKVGYTACTTYFVELTDTRQEQTIGEPLQILLDFPGKDILWLGRDIWEKFECNVNKAVSSISTFNFEWFASRGLFLPYWR